MSEGKTPLSPAVEALIRERTGYLIRGTLIVTKLADPDFEDDDGPCSRCECTCGARPINGGNQ
jgi:hypothetical protein